MKCDLRPTYRPLVNGRAPTLARILGARGPVQDEMQAADPLDVAVMRAIEGRTSDDMPEVPGVDADPVHVA